MLVGRLTYTPLLPTVLDGRSDTFIQAFGPFVASMATHFLRTGHEPVWYAKLRLFAEL
jgi:hypothetical protein